MKKTFATLIKLQKLSVDEQRQVLARLQDALEKIEHRIAELEIQKTRESLAVAQNPDARSTYGAFLQGVATKGRGLERERKAAAHAVDQARAKLSELFEEQKRYEIAEEQRIEAEIKEEQRQERIELDEIGGTVHERNRSN